MTVCDEIESIDGKQVRSGGQGSTRLHTSLKPWLSSFSLITATKFCPLPSDVARQQLTARANKIIALVALQMLYPLLW